MQLFCLGCAFSQVGGLLLGCRAFLLSLFWCITLSTHLSAVDAFGHKSWKDLYAVMDFAVLLVGSRVSPLFGLISLS